MKKAKLDLLEGIPGIDAEMPGSHQIALDHDIEDRVGIAGKWAGNKLFIIFAPMVLGVLVISGLLFFYLTRTTTPGPQKSATISSKTSTASRQTAEQKMKEKAGIHQNTGNRTVVASETLKMIYLKDFMIDLVDSKGNNYVLMCDVAFDIGAKTTPDQLENNTGVRNIIYKTAKNRSVVALRSVEERKKMKKELASELDKMLGEGSVKNVYFMNYFIM